MGHSLSTLEHQHEQAAYAELDRQAQAQDARQARIDELKAEYIKDEDIVQNAIENASDLIAHHWVKGDMKAVHATIDYQVELIAEGIIDDD